VPGYVTTDQWPKKKKRERRRRRRKREETIKKNTCEDSVEFIPRDVPLYL
jgi:hypothetical protein